MIVPAWVSNRKRAKLLALPWPTTKADVFEFATVNTGLVRLSVWPGRPLTVGRPCLAVDRRPRLRPPRRARRRIEEHPLRELDVLARRELRQKPEVGQRHREARVRAHLGRVAP